MERGELLDWYLLKLGIFRVEPRSLAEAKGLSNEAFASATPLRCWQEVTATREVDSCWRAQVRSRVLEAEESDMVMQLTTEWDVDRNCVASNWRAGEKREGVDEVGSRSWSQSFR